MNRKILSVAALAVSLAAAAGGCGSSSSGSSGSNGSGDGGGSGGSSSGGGNAEALAGHSIKTIFIILMENNNWSDIYMQAVAPYITSLTTNAQASWCSNYFDNPDAVHPSEPNYIWLEAGNNLGFTTDADPSATHELSAPHLSKLMDSAGVSWKEYAEDITAGSCPIASKGFYGAKHVPFVFFDDVVGTPPSATAQHCIDHVVPYTQLMTDLANDKVAQYNFITPNLCNDMHGAIGCPTTPEITQGDTWLSQQVPMIMASKAYKDGGAIFITWDESEGGEFPIGMIALSPVAKGKGYKSTTKYYHSSMVRTVEEVFDLMPLLNDAAKQADLSDLFASFP
jgi:hypothetical protein